MPGGVPAQEIDAIYRTVPIGLCVLDRDLRYVRVNDHLALMNGVPAADHIGRRVFDLFPELTATLEPVLRRVLESGEYISHQEVIVPAMKGGRSRAFVVHGTPFRDADGQVCGINLAIEDISARHYAETRLRNLERRLWLQTENSPLAVIEWDREYRVTRWGGAAETMFGWRADEVIGKRIDELDMIVQEDWPIVQETMRRLSSTRGRHVVSSNRNYTRDGRTIVCEWYNSIVRDEHGASVLSLVLDVTEQRQMAGERRQLLEALQRSNRIKDQFLATLAHELRQPLGALTTALGVLRLSRESPASERAWHIAERQLEIFTRLVDDLSDLSRIERGKVRLARDLLELRQIVEGAVDVNEHLVRTRRQQLQVSWPESPAPVIGDAARLQQVFSNILNNASKFTPEGGSIGIAATIDTNQAKVIVRDSGPGIPADQLEAIFEPFAQGIQRPGEGLGIGLAVVRQLVDLHGGTVHARSAGPGQGSEFVVTLPLAPSSDTSPTDGTA